MPASVSDIVKTLRGLLNTTQNGLMERQLVKEYREMEGCLIPYQQFGYRTLGQFLEASQEFDLTNTHEGLHVRAKLAKETLHLTQMVESQNRTKRKKTTKPMPFVSRYSRTFRPDSNRNVTPQPQFQQRQTQQVRQTQPIRQNQPIRQVQPIPQNQPIRPVQPIRPIQPIPQNQQQVQQIAAQYQMAKRTEQAIQNILHQARAQLSTKLVSLLPSAQAQSGNSNAQNRRSDRSAQIPSNQTRPNTRWDEPVQAAAATFKSDYFRTSNSNLKSVPKFSDAYKKQPSHETNTSSAVPNTNAANNIENNRWNQEFEKAQSAKPMAPQGTAAKKSVFERLGTRETQEESRPNIQERLKVNRVMKTPPASLASTPSLARTPPKAAPTPPKFGPDTVDFVSTKQAPQPDIAPVVEQVKTMTLEGEDHSSNPKARLERYCQQKGFDPPVYLTSFISKYQKFEGLVKVDGMKYSTQPLDYAKKLEADTAAAVVALNNLKDFPITEDSDEEIVRKIHECITDGGLFLKYVPSVFEQNHGSSLPENWMELIKGRPDLFSISAQLTNLDIIYKRNPTYRRAIEPPRSPATESTRHIDNNHKEDEELTLPPHDLPWDTPVWTIDISWVSATDDIWGRLIESEQFIELGASLEKIEAKLCKGLRPKLCRDVKVGEVYLAIHSDQESDGTFLVSAYRVRVEMVEEKKNEAYCFYIDDGYQEWLAYNTPDPADQKLYQIDQNLLHIPGQAIHFSLFNLAEFADNEDAKTEAAKLLTDKTFTAKIRSTKEDYEAQLNESNLDPKVNVIFCESDADRGEIIVNKQIVENVFAKMQPPKFDDKTNAFMKHVSDDGEIYFWLHGNTEMKTIKRMIARVTAKPMNESHRVEFNELTYGSDQKLRLIYDDVDERWYRAEILPKMQQNGIANCKCVDYGYIKKVVHKNIYKLERLSLALSKYPPQAIPARLAGFNAIDYTPKFIGQIRELLRGHIVLVQVAKQSDVPLIIVWKRVEGVFYKLNDALRMTLDLENSMPLPDSDDSCSSDENEDSKEIEIPLHEKPQLGHSEQVTVVSAITPTKFYVCLSSDVPELTKMMDSLWKECESCNKVLSRSDIRLNHFYAARIDGYWYRVKAQSFISSTVINVQKVDCGDITQLTIDALRPLSPSYRKIPQMVFPAQLHGLRPRQGVWMEHDCAQFQKLTVNKTFMGQFKHIQMQNDIYTAELVLLSSNNVNLSEKLVQEGRANYI